MAEFDRDNRVWSLEHGDLAYWVDEASKMVARCRVELITDSHVYVVFTASDGNRKRGEHARAGAFYGRCVAPREAIQAKVTSTMRLTKPIMWDTIVPRKTPEDVLMDM